METARKWGGTKPRIKLIGVGGFGGKVLDVVGEKTQVDLVRVDRDYGSNDADSGITQIVMESGPASDGPDYAVALSKSAKTSLTALFADTDLLVLVSGMGGRIGTMASAVIAELAGKFCIPVVAFVTEPFDYEGARRRQFAQKGIAALSQVSSVFVLSNERLSDSVEKSLTLSEAYKTCLASISNIVVDFINLAYGKVVGTSEFIDACDFFGKSGAGLAGSGQASGDLKVDLAMSEALDPIPLNHPGLRESDGFLVILTAGSELLLSQINTAMRWIENIASPDACTVCSTVVDLRLKTEIRVTVMAVRVPQQADKESALCSH